MQSVREVSQLSRTALKDKYLQKYSSKLAEITSHLDAVISSIDSADAIKRSWSSPASASGMELHGKLLAERALKAIGEFGKELGSSLDEKDPDKKVRSSMFFIPWHSYGGSWFYPGYTPPSSHHSVPHGGFGGSGGGGIS